MQDTADDDDFIGYDLPSSSHAAAVEQRRREALTQPKRRHTDQPTPTTNHT